MNPFRPTAMEEGMGPVCRTNYCGRRQFSYAMTVEQPNTFLEELRKLENEINEVGNENLCTTNAPNNGGMAASSGHRSSTHSSRVPSDARHDDSLQTSSRKQDHRRRHSRESRHNRREHRDSRDSHSSDHHRHRKSPESERRRRHDKQRRSRSSERRRSDDRRSRSRHGEKRHRSRSPHRKSTDRSSLEKRREHFRHSGSFERQQSSQQKGAEDQAESTKFTVPILFSAGASSNRRGSLYEDVSDTNSKDGDEPLTKKNKSSYAQKEVPEPSVIYIDKLQPSTVREYSFWGTESHTRPSAAEGKNFETTSDIWKCMPGAKALPNYGREFCATAVKENVMQGLARDTRIHENLGSRREQPTDTNKTTDVRQRDQCNHPLGLQRSEFDLPNVPNPPAGPVEQYKTLKPSPLENRECENKTVPADGRNTPVTGRRPVIDYIDKNGRILYSRPIRDGSNVDRTPRMSEIIIGNEKVTKPRRVGSSHRENSQASSNNHGTKTSDRSSNIDQFGYRRGTPAHTAALWKAALQVLPTPEATSEAQASAHTAALWEVASQVLPTPEATSGAQASAYTAALWEVASQVLPTPEATSEAQASAHTAALWEVASQVLPTPEATSEAQASAHTAALWEVASQVLPSPAQERPRCPKDKLQEEFDRFMDGIPTSNSVNTSTNNINNTLPQPPYQTTSTGTQLSSAGRLTITIANLNHESENKTTPPKEINVTGKTMHEQATVKTSNIVNDHGPSQPELSADDSIFTKGVVHTNEEKNATNNDTRAGTPGQIDVHASSDLKTTGQKADEFIFKVPPVPKRRRLARPLLPPRWQLKLASWSKKSKKRTKHKANNQSQRNPSDKLKSSSEPQQKQVNESKRHATFKIKPRSSASSWNILSTPKKNMGLWIKKFAVSIYAPDKNMGGKVEAPGTDMDVSVSRHAPDPRLTARVRHKKTGRLPSHRRVVAAPKQRSSASKNPIRVNSAKKPLKRLQIKGVFRKIDGKLQPITLGARLKKKIRWLLQKKYGNLQILVTPQLTGAKGAIIKQKPVDPSDSIVSLNNQSDLAENIVSDTRKCARKPEKKSQGTLSQENRAQPAVPTPIDGVEIKQGSVDPSNTNQITNNLNKGITLAENVTLDPKKRVRKIRIKIQRPALQKKHTHPTILPVEGSGGVTKQEPVDPSDSNQTATDNLDKKGSFVKTTARRNRHGEQEMSNAKAMDIQNILKKLPLTKEPGLVLKLENPRVDKLYPIYANDLPLIAEMKLFYRKLGSMTSMMSANSIKIIMAEEFKDQLAKSKGLDIEKCIKALEIGCPSTKKGPTSNQQDPGSNNKQLDLNKGRPKVVCPPPMPQLLEKNLQRLHWKKGKELNDYFLSISFDIYQHMFLLLVRTVGYYKCKKFRFTRFREVFGIMKYEIGRILLARAEALKNEMMGLMFLERMALGAARVILSTPTEMALMDSFAEHITPFTLEKKVEDLIRETKDYLLTQVPRPVDRKNAKTDFAKGVDKFENIIYKTKLVADRRAKNQRARYFKRRTEIDERKEKARIEAEKAAADASANNPIRERAPDSEATGEGCSSTVVDNKTRSENCLSEEGAPKKSSSNNDRTNSTNAFTTTDNATTKKEPADPSGMQNGVKSKKGSEEVKKTNN